MSGLPSYSFFNDIDMGLKEDCNFDTLSINNSQINELKDNIYPGYSIDNHGLGMHSFDVTERSLELCNDTFLFNDVSNLSDKSIFSFESKSVDSLYTEKHSQSFEYRLNSSSSDNIENTFSNFIDSSSPFNYQENYSVPPQKLFDLSDEFHSQNVLKEFDSPQDQDVLEELINSPKDQDILEEFINSPQDQDVLEELINSPQDRLEELDSPQDELEELGLPQYVSEEFDSCQYISVSKNLDSDKLDSPTLSEILNSPESLEKLEFSVESQSDLHDNLTRNLDATEDSSKLQIHKTPLILEQKQNKDSISQNNQELNIENNISSKSLINKNPITLVLKKFKTNNLKMVAPFKAPKGTYTLVQIPDGRQSPEVTILPFKNLEDEKYLKQKYKFSNNIKKVCHNQNENIVIIKSKDKVEEDIKSKDKVDEELQNINIQNLPFTSLKRKNSISDLSKSVKKKKAYELEPLPNPTLEKCRRNAINAKKNRDIKKEKMVKLEVEVEKVSKENNELTEENEILRQKNKELARKIEYLSSLLQKKNTN